MRKVLNIIFIQGVMIVICILIAVRSFAQGSRQENTNTATSTVTIAANPEYNKAGKFKRFMLGDHYRKEWATPVDIEVLDMDEFAGGLTPVKMGGGLQTKSLRLKGADGKEYVLRSVRKDPSKALVEELRETFADDIVRDQISSSNPYAPLVVSSLAGFAGIYHSTPRLVYVPSSKSLGDYAATFQETLCLLEERPGGNEEDNAAYGYSKNVVNSEKLFEKVFSNSDHQVDERAFLKARLFDLLIGDWDRHEDQWLWASFKKGDKIIYKPIPRDRDQAFSKLDGVIPWMSTQKWALRKIQNYDYRIKDVNGLAMSGNHLDRNFTTRLTLNDWKAIAAELQHDLTDEVIAVSFRAMPEPIYNISGKETIAKLKRRRDDLEKYAVTYYKFLTEQVVITGTKNKETFEITRLNNDSTSVTVYNESKEKAVFHRIFLRSETKEIRVYGLDGNDVFEVYGGASKGILVRVIGGKGQDSITDRSYVKGGGSKTKIYDDANNTFDNGGEARKFISTDTLKNNYNRKSFRYNWMMPMQRPGYNPDDGVYVGAAVIFKRQQFGKSPYGYMQTIGANYAFKTGAYSFWYQGIFKEFIGKWDLQIDGQINAPNYSRNYFGMGNETEKLDEKDKNYYRVRFNQELLTASLKRQIGKNLVDAGVGFESVKVESNEERFVSNSHSSLDSSDFTRENYGKVHVGYQYSSVDNPLYPTKGIKFTSKAMFTQNLGDQDIHYAQLSSEFAAYNSFGKLTLATRTGVATNVGNEYAFYQANTVGSATVRGYSKDRFAGKTSLYQNTELRYSIGYTNMYFTKGACGVLGFFDNGIVWVPEQTSSTWHHGYGGGLWFLPFNKLALTATYGVSKEDKLISVSAGFLF